MSAQGLAECHKKFVSHEKNSAVSRAQPNGADTSIFEKLSETSMIMLDEETIGTKKKVSMWNAEESKKPNTNMVSD